MPQTRRRRKHQHIARPMPPFRLINTGDHVLVYGQDDQVHEPLTHHHARLRARMADSSATTMTKALYPWFAALEADGVSWKASQQALHGVFDQLLRKKYKQVDIRRDRRGIARVTLGPDDSLHSARLLHAAIRSYYHEMAHLRLYPGVNPFFNEARAADAKQHLQSRVGRPPAHSGLSEEADHRAPPSSWYDLYGGRSSTAYDQDGQQLAHKIFDAAGHAQWPLRDYAVTAIGLETGLRISANTGLRMGGWSRYGFGRRISAADKGSGSVMTRVIVISEQTQLLLRAYVESERARHDPLAEDFSTWARGRAYTPEHLLMFYNENGINPDHVPLFYSEYKNPYTAGAYRQTAWYPARQLGRWKSSPHQMRRFKVDVSIAAIDDRYKHDAAMHRRAEQFLIESLWSPTSGRRMLDLYRRKPLLEERLSFEAELIDLQQNLYAKLTTEALSQAHVVLSAEVTETRALTETRVPLDDDLDELAEATK